MATNIKLTKEGLKSRFDEYNKLYFDGKLEKCGIHVFRNDNGEYGRINKKISSTGKVLYSIWINDNCDWTEWALREVMLHEMIHYYVYSVEKVKFDGLLGHGRHFRRQCSRFKKDFGIEISIHAKGFPPKRGKSSPKIWEKILIWLIDR